ncbi:hypothetical protein [Pseudobutyrivibrio sp.]|jgi:hypothetical protein|uniref:hypothetical protein n=1 Tax=Pseudobutyrivibrio sp. TaxID=2014367 RepID=UPI0025F581CD|nr:hypothetical protein [Pseudobutyrivibrio sp.]
MKKKTVILACALSALLFVGCGKSAEVVDVSDVASVESIAEEVKESVTETEEKDKETATSVSGNDENNEAADEGASNENTTGETVDGKNSEDKTGEAAQATAQENAQANQDLQMEEGIDYSEWTQRQTWTASNGVTLKIKDNVDLNAQGFVDYVIMDGDTHPDSPFMVALHEYVGKTNLQDVPSELPVINNSSVKRTSFPNTDPVFLDYQSKVNQILLSQTDSFYIKLVSDGTTTMLGNGFENNAWKLISCGDYYEVRIYRNMPIVAWNSLRDCLKFVSPDGQLLYDVIYTDFFEGSDYIEDYDMWCPVGGSEIYQFDPEGLGYIQYNFR